MEVSIMLGQNLTSSTFTDLYLSESESWFAGVPDELDPCPASQNLVPELQDLWVKCSDAERKLARGDFALRHDTITYRVSKMPSIAGVIYVLRRFPAEIPDINKIGMYPGIVRRLMKPNLRGMILIGGATGSGKTWTASALVKARLELFGGVAVTAEDPPEMPLHGRHGKGVCFQVPVSRESGGFGEASRHIVRWKPNIIFLGEIRDPEVAIEALRASINGHLVISTVHADNAISMIQRVAAFASSSGGNEATSLLADGLIAAIHQRLETVGARKVLKSEFLILTDESARGARTMIRESRFPMLTTEIRQQQNQMMNEPR
jgi:Tfp pilus assembly pilus retraction ATPase PilT